MFRSVFERSALTALIVAALLGVAAGRAAAQQPAGDTAADTMVDTAADTAAATTQPVPAPAPVVPDPLDSIAELNAQLKELEQRLEEQSSDEFPGFDPEQLEEEIREDIRRDLRDELNAEADWTTAFWYGPFHSVWSGIAGIISVLATFAVLGGLGFATVYFGGGEYLEGVAETARRDTLRSGFVGLAASFLILPAFVLGIVALAVSIIGIPLILAWLALFPLAVLLAALLGYLAVAHLAGEKAAERHFYGGNVFDAPNSYYYLLTGLGLLLVLFLVSNIVQIAGPWFDLLEGTLLFLAIVLTWAAFTVGFGAVLISRGGTEPPAPEAESPEPETTTPLLEEESHA